MSESAKPTFADRYNAILEAYQMSPTDMSRLMEMPIAKFYKYGKDVQPRNAVLQKMLERIPDLSEEFLFRGVGPIRATKRISLSVEMDRLKTENQTLKAIVTALEQKVAQLEAKREEYEQFMMEFARKGFPSFGSLSPAFAQPQDSICQRMEVAGFGREPQAFSGDIRRALSLVLIGGYWCVPAKDLKGIEA